MATNYPEYDPENPAAGYSGGSSANSAEEAALVAKSLEEDQSSDFDPYAPPSPVINTPQGEVKFALFWTRISPGHRQQVGYLIPVPFSILLTWSKDFEHLCRLDERFYVDEEVEEAFRFVAFKHLYAQYAASKQTPFDSAPEAEHPYDFPQFF